MSVCSFTQHSLLLDKPQLQWLCSVPGKPWRSSASVLLDLATAPLEDIRGARTMWRLRAWALKSGQLGFCSLLTILGFCFLNLRNGKLKKKLPPTTEGLWQALSGKPVCSE